MTEKTLAGTAIERYMARFNAGFEARFRVPANAVVQHSETGTRYPRFIRFSDGSGARVDETGDVQEF